ncbi:MAG: response regulator [Candidatus Eremiobacterota bacterium]
MDKEVRVLVLEDDDQLREVLELLLEAEGYAVMTASRAREALELADKHRFDLVVADVRMEEMDGLECLNHLVKKQPALRSIVITGYASPEAPLRAMLVRSEDYLRKPFSKAQFQESVRRVLGSRREREGYYKLFRAGLRWLTGAQDEETKLQHCRDDLFRNFFVAVRSGALGEGEALILWRRLEALDMQRETGQGSPSELLQEFQLMTSLLRFAVRHWEEDVSPEEFTRLYGRLTDGTLSAEQLMLAPLLRHMDPQHRQSSPELNSLYERLWGSAVPA